MVALPEIFDAAAHQVLSNLDLALDLAAQGVAVFPCQPDGEGVKCPYPGVFWRNQSTTSEHRIRQWWDRWPDALPAIDLAKIGRFVIDLDGAGGLRDWETVTAGREWWAPSIETPSGGRHLWFAQPEGVVLGNGRGSLPPKGVKEGIDVRGAGGYVIAPGAVLFDGRRYEPDGDDFLSAPPAPDWLVGILTKDPAPQAEGVALRTEPGPPVSDERKRQYGEKALAEEMRTLAAAVPGARNETANLCAFRIGQLVGGGCLTEREAYAALHNAAASWGIRANDKALGPRGTIARAIRDGARSPRGPAEEPTTIISLARHVAEAPPHDPETGEVIEEPAADAWELPTGWEQAPGLVGELADWICATARRPQPALAVGAALAIVGTLAGRHVVGPTGSGTHLYVVGLAPTGAGKDHALQQTMACLTAADAAHLIGPSQFISMPAVINFLVRAPLSLCAMDEFGAFLKRINNRKASGFEGAITGILRTAWGSSGKAMPTPEWAGRAAQVIQSPALSIYGVSTAEEFYSALEGGDTSNGVLNRLLVIETRQRPKDRAPAADPLTVPAALADALKAVLNRAGPMVAAQLQRFDVAPPVYRVPWGKGAEAAFQDMVEEIYSLCDGNVMAQAFYARAAETAVRIATILAVGENPSRPVVTAELFAWARTFSMWAARNLERGGTEHISDSENQTHANLVRRAIRENAKRDGTGRIKHRDLLRCLNHRIKNRDLVEVVKALVEAEEIGIEKTVPEGGGPPTIRYWLCGKDA
jgi:hypothetical protein